MNEEKKNSTRLQSGLLYSERYGDHYSSRDAPDEEKAYVFCNGNGLAERFAHADRFSIAELGFGAGTSFLATQALWQRLSRPGARLDFVSIEKYPLTPTLLAKYLQRFEPWRENVQRLLDDWPATAPGHHRLHLADGVTLTLIVADVLDALRQLDASIDAWYLDGFSPAKNPEMWQPVVFREMARLSHQGTTFATYTAAGAVRRGLTSAGFIVEKAPGHGRKRERLVGRFRVPRSTGLTRLSRHFRENPGSRPRSVAIVGAGLAGAACAQRFAERGWNVTLLEKQVSVTAGSSANPAAIMQPLLTRDDSVAGRFFRQGYFYTLHQLARLERRGIDTGFHHGGLLSLPKSTDDRRRKRAAADSEPWPAQTLQWKRSSEIDGMPPDIDAEGLLYPASGWFNLAKLTQGLLDAAGAAVTLVTDAAVERLQREGNVWRLHTPTRVFEADRVVLATGHWLGDFDQAAGLPIIINRGQLDWADAEHLPPLPISHSGYVVPDGHRLFFGSTYQRSDEPPRHPAEERKLNLAALRHLSPTLAAGLVPGRGGHWRGQRLTTPDHLPLIGPLPEPECWRQIHGPALFGRAAGRCDGSAWHDGLYCLSGLGSRALVSALLGAELLASLIDRAPLPVPRDVVEAVQPARFLVRQLLRERVH